MNIIYWNLSSLNAYLSSYASVPDNIVYWRLEKYFNPLIMTKIGMPENGEVCLFLLRKYPSCWWPLVFSARSSHNRLAVASNSSAWSRIQAPPTSALINFLTTSKPSCVLIRTGSLPRSQHPAAGAGNEGPYSVHNRGEAEGPYLIIIQ